MPVLSESAVRGLVVLVILPNAGIPLSRGDKREMFVEIARLESGFETNALGMNHREKGIWQIHPVHIPDLIADGVIKRESDLWRPVDNAQAAAWVYKKQGFSAWTTANEASYAVVDQGNVELDVSESRADEWVTEQMGGDIDFGPIDVIRDPSLIGEVPSIVGETFPNIPGFGWTEQLGRFFSILSNPDFWKRVGLGALAAGIIIIAIIVYNQQTIKDLK